MAKLYGGSQALIRGSDRTKTASATALNGQPLTILSERERVNYMAQIGIYSLYQNAFNIMTVVS